jgi:hypothetical protein
MKSCCGFLLTVVDLSWNFCEISDFGLLTRLQRKLPHPVCKIGVIAGAHLHGNEVLWTSEFMLLD